MEKAVDAAIEDHDNALAKAARALGLTERVMGLRIVKYAIDPRQFK